jgi:hypothetical protein
MNEIPPIRHSRGPEGVYRNLPKNLSDIVQKIRKGIEQNHPGARVLFNVDVKGKKCQITVTAHREGEPVSLNVEDLKSVEKAAESANPVASLEGHGSSTRIIADIMV